jgi:hypothetical protein
MHPIDLARRRKERRAQTDFSGHPEMLSCRTKSKNIRESRRTKQGALDQEKPGSSMRFTFR